MERKFKENSFHDNGFYSCFALKKLGKNNCHQLSWVLLLLLHIQNLVVILDLIFEQQLNIRTYD